MNRTRKKEIQHSTRLLKVTELVQSMKDLGIKGVSLGNFEKMVNGKGWHTRAMEKVVAAVKVIQTGNHHSPGKVILRGAMTKKAHLEAITTAAHGARMYLHRSKKIDRATALLAQYKVAM
jgi:hypothetical protein